MPRFASYNPAAPWTNYSYNKYPDYSGGGGSRSAGYYGGAIGSSPGYTATGSVEAINAANRTAQQEANLARIPNAVGLEAQSSKMIEDQLLGKLPADVMALLGTQAGERGIAGGMVGSPNAGAAYLRALGLTSLQQQQTGQQNLSQAYARNPSAPIYNAGEFAITPLQAAQLNLELQRLNASRSGGGGGGGGGGRYGSPVVQSEGSGGYIPTASSLFGDYGRRGTMYSSPGIAWQPTTVAGAIADQGGRYEGSSGFGYQPTSSGGMYSGTLEGFDPEYWDWTGTGWMDYLGG